MKSCNAPRIGKRACTLSNVTTKQKLQLESLQLPDLKIHNISIFASDIGCIDRWPLQRCLFPAGVRHAKQHERQHRISDPIPVLGLIVPCSRLSTFASAYVSGRSSHILLSWSHSYIVSA